MSRFPLVLGITVLTFAGVLALAALQFPALAQHSPCNPTVEVCL